MCWILSNVKIHGLEVFCMVGVHFHLLSYNLLLVGGVPLFGTFFIISFSITNVYLVFLYECPPYLRLGHPIDFLVILCFDSAMGRSL